MRCNSRNCQSVFGEYLALRDYKLSRRKDLDGQIETLATMTLATEIGD